MKDMSRTKIVIYNLVIALFLFLLIDFSITHTYLKELINPKHRVSHPYFSGTLKAGYQGHARFGYLEHALCVDTNGFKTSCDKTERATLSFDVVFIGDSFTEAVGMNYEDSFVGMYDLTHPMVEVANLGVSGYRINQYLKKITYYLERGLKTKHVVVFIDSVDIFDEFSSAINHSLDQYWRKDQYRGIDFDRYFDFGRYWQAFKDFIRLNFYFTRQALFHFKRSIDSSVITHKAKTEWSYSSDQSGILEASVITAISFAKMERLWTLLNQHGIALSVGVYPYREQLLYGDENSRQVQIWEQFCKQRCFSFINAFPAFFDLKKQLAPDEVIRRYFIAGDAHYNKKGNEVVFEVLNEQFKIDH